ncbi:aspartate/glutamate racemase family protein [Lactococcus allomyrinae]|uniref:Amino acid racemase n=1 Tax=Lactococcus allomyrinae TaxID=2419773 RepID=A0A387BC34_9LACT|nr:amino acid racemase [Lactococcus allomyrinae]AYG01353.1 amino acid racemase [Lactococcus allomyrinae]
MENFFTILGGMGTLATESFIHTLNRRTDAHRDQDFLDYIVVNHATIPDRTAYIKDSSLENPEEKLIEDIKIQSVLNPKFFVIPCNTAHYYFEELQNATRIPILHMPRIAVERIREQFADSKRIAVLATEGTILTGVYREELEAQGYEAVIPDEELQEKVNRLIYQEVKENKNLNFELYHEILSDVKKKMNCEVMILGCTELSVLYEEYQLDSEFNIIDAQAETVRRTLLMMEKKDLANE